MTVYVSNLGSTVKDEDLKNYFKDYGTVSSAKVIMDNFTKQSRGFGFVEMPDEAAAQKAIIALDGAVRDGIAIRVNEARPDAAVNTKSFFNRW